MIRRMGDNYFYTSEEVNEALTTSRLVVTDVIANIKEDGDKFYAVITRKTDGAMVGYIDSRPERYKVENILAACHIELARADEKG